MLPSKPRSGLSDTSNNKTVPAEPKIGKIGRAGSTKSYSAPSPIQKSHISSKTVESKPAIERRQSKSSSTAPDKKLHAPKGSESQVQEKFKKAKERLAYVEQEKAQVLEELNDAKNLADVANEKLKKALAAQKKAEESSEIEKFRADELEQANIDASHKRDEELDSIKKKCSLDVETLLSTTRELQKVKDELQLTTKAKNSALTQAEDAVKTAEINAGKVQLLSNEISRLKSLLDSKLDGVNGDASDIIKKMNFEIDSLRDELERAKQGEEKLVIMDSLVELLSTEADNAKNGEMDSLKLVDKWKKKAEFLEIQLTEAEKSKKSSMESLASVTKQLEESKALLQDSEFETAALREKVELLVDQLESQASLSKQLEEANALLLDAESVTAVLRGKVESLEIEVAAVKKAGLDSVKLADEWKKKVEILEVQLEKARQFMDSSSESLASVTRQLEESNSSLLDVLSDNAALRVKIESLEMDLARYKEVLDVARQEATEMGKKVESLQSEIQTLKEKFGALDSEKVVAFDAKSFSEERNKLIKELEMAKQEEEKAKKTMEGLASALHEMSIEAGEKQERLFAKRVEHEDAHALIEQLQMVIRNTKENYEVMLDETRYEIVCLKKAIEKLETDAKESQANCDDKEFSFVSPIHGSEELSSFETQVGKVEKLSSANEAVEVVKAETLSLKEILFGGQNELESISQDNADIHIREAETIIKVNELSTSLSESGEFSNSEKEYDLLPNSKEIPIKSVNGRNEEKPKSVEGLKLKEENGKANHYLGEEEPVEVEVKMWEGYKASEKEKDFSSEMENEGESIDDELDLKIESGRFDQTNGLPSVTNEDAAVSQTKQQQQQKKPMFRKFGSLLKKKSPRCEPLKVQTETWYFLHSSFLAQI